MTTQLGDAVRHRLIGDDDVAPDLRIQRLAGNDFTGALRQANEHVHHPGFEMHLGTAAHTAAHDAILTRLDQALADAESALQLLGCERHCGRSLPRELVGPELAESYRIAGGSCRRGSADRSGLMLRAMKSLMSE